MKMLWGYFFRILSTLCSFRSCTYPGSICEHQANRTPHTYAKNRCFRYFLCLVCAHTSWYARSQKAMSSFQCRAPIVYATKTCPFFGKSKQLSEKKNTPLPSHKLLRQAQFAPLQNLNTWFFPILGLQCRRRAQCF